MLFSLLVRREGVVMPLCQVLIRITAKIQDWKRTYCRSSEPLCSTLKGLNCHQVNSVGVYCGNGSSLRFCLELGGKQNEQRCPQALLFGVCLLLATHWGERALSRHGCSWATHLSTTVSLEATEPSKTPLSLTDSSRGRSQPGSGLTPALELGPWQRV